MTPEDKTKVESILLTNPQIHVFAHVTDSKIVEFLGQSECVRIENGAIRLALVGEPGQETSPEIFNQIEQPIRIEILPINTNPQMLQNIILRRSRISYREGLISLSADIYDVANARESDNPHAPRTELKPPEPTAMMLASIEYRQQREQIDRLLRRNGELLALWLGSLTLIPSDSLVGDLLDGKREAHETFASALSFLDRLAGYGTLSEADLSMLRSLQTGLNKLTGEA